MDLLIAALLLPLYFTAPADSLGADRTGHVGLSTYPVHSYEFHRLSANGEMVIVPGYADSLGKARLIPHAPGTRETVWLEAGPNGSAVTIFVTSSDDHGNMSALSNPCVVGGVAAPSALTRAVPTSHEAPTGRKAAR